jgi:REP element-mobilizing transposase RayT
LFANVNQHERFLAMYERVARKYHWETPSWALMKNHHHFVVHLTQGGLSEGMRELHGGYSRWVHTMYGQTRQGHLFRHAFFARRLKTDGAVLVACSYDDLNAAVALRLAKPEEGTWCSYPATIGLEHPRPFHTAAILLRILDEVPARAQAAYREFVENGLAFRGQGPSPNDGVSAHG